MLASPDEAPAEVSAAPRGVGDRFCDLAVFIVSTYYLNLQSVLHIYMEFQQRFHGSVLTKSTLAKTANLSYGLRFSPPLKRLQGLGT